MIPCGPADRCFKPVILYFQSAVTAQTDGLTGIACMNEHLHADACEVCYVVNVKTSKKDTPSDVIIYIMSDAADFHEKTN